MPALVTLDVQRARNRVGSRSMEGMKQAVHRAARRMGRAYCEAMRCFDNPDDAPDRWDNKWIPLWQRDEPQLREPRPLTGWDID